MVAVTLWPPYTRFMSKIVEAFRRTRWEVLTLSENGDEVYKRSFPKSRIDDIETTLRNGYTRSFDMRVKVDAGGSPLSAGSHTRVRQWYVPIHGYITPLIRGGITVTDVAFDPPDVTPDNITTPQYIELGKRVEALYRWTKALERHLNARLRKGE